MGEQLEHDLREALAARAAELDAGAGVRVLSRGYRARVTSAPALAGGGAGLAAVGVGAALLATGLGTEAPKALAGWSSKPTPPSPQQIRGADEACRSRLRPAAAIEPTRRVESGSQERRPGPMIAAGGWKEILTDRRGPYTITLFTASEGRAVVTCFTGRDGMGSLGGAFGNERRPPVGAGKIELVTSGGNVTPPDEGSAQFSRVVGRTGPGVGRVVLRLRDGRRVTATVASGWFLAWWPGASGLVATEVGPG